MEAEKIPITCCVTGKTIEVKPTRSGKPRPPSGWKRIGDDYYSAEAWRDRYCIRAIVVPIASAVSEGQATQDDWRQLRDALHEAWTRSTEATNWALRRLLTNDVQRDPGEAKCPKMPAIYLYGERDWSGWSQSAAAVLRATEAKYRSCRYEVVWTGSRQLPSMRFPQPYPVHNAAWRLTEGPDGGVSFGCLLPTGRIAVRLKGGHRYRRQLAGLRHLIEHPELRGEASIYKRGNDIVVKLVGWFPRDKQRDATGTMYVLTDKESFLVGLNARDERLWIIHGDRAREWSRRYYAGLQRWRDDQKYEMRHPKRQQRKTAEDQQKRTRKFRNRINTFVDESAAQIVNHAKRRRLAKIVYNDSETGYYRDFPWYRLRDAIQTRCHQAGIEFEHSTDDKNAVSARTNATPQEA